MVLVTEHGVDHGQALEIVTNMQFIRHAHAAMQLHRLLAHEAAGISNLYFGGGNGLGALYRIFIADFQIDHVAHGSGLLTLHEHIDHAMLQNLELGQRHTELYPRLEILVGGFL